MNPLGPLHLVALDTHGIPTAPEAAAVLQIRGTVDFGDGPRPAGVPLYVGSTPLTFRPKRNGSHRGQAVVYERFSETDLTRARALAASGHLIDTLITLVNDVPIDYQDPKQVAARDAAIAVIFHVGGMPGVRSS